MPDWLERYQGGEHDGVWAEMQSLGMAIRKTAYRKAADAVVRETIERARQNVQQLFAELRKLGYRFESPSEPAEPDLPLELRLEHALAYAREHGGRMKSSPFAHPALAWVDEEDIPVPARFRNGLPGRANYRPPSARTQQILTSAEPLPLAVRRWFETIGSVDLKGTHPRLNPHGGVGVLRVTLEGIEGMAGSGAGAGFVAAIREAFRWAGFPGWADRTDRPERELVWLRSKLQPL